MSYDISNWYWAVATNPGFVWHTGSTNAYVSTADATYVAWEAIAENDATVIATEALLWEVFDSYNNANWKPSFYEPAIFTVNTTLTNPMAQNIVVSFNAAGKTLTLPAVNRPGAPPIGAEISIRNEDPAATDHSFQLLKSGGSSVISELRYQETLLLTLKDNSTAAGTWSTTILPPRARGVRTVTGTSDTIGVGDFGRLINCTNSAPVSITLPQATSTSFSDGWWCSILTKNTIGTITPTTSTIDGGASYSLRIGQSVTIWSDGTNYKVNSPGNVIGSSAAVVDSRPALFDGTSGKLLKQGAVVLTESGAATAAWTDYTPVLTASSGTITSYTITTARYLQIGKLVHVIFNIVITNNGTGAGALLITLPVDAAGGRRGGGHVKEVDTSGDNFGGNIFGTTQFIWSNDDGLYPGGTNTRHIGAFFYESV